MALAGETIYRHFGRPNRKFLGVKTVMTVPIIFILCVLAWSYYAYVYHLCLGRVTPIEVQVLYLFVYHVILVLFLWSYLKTIIIKPGAIPPKFRLPNEVFEDYSRNLDVARQKIILRDFSKNLPIVTFTNTDDIRFCDKCRIVKPDRSHHCSKCRKCVLKMDHHCPWINNCVSYSNYKYFILFLAYGLLMCIYVLATTAKYAVKFWDIMSERIQSDLYKIHIFLLFIITSMFSFGLFSFFAFHIYLVAKNRTTYEYLHPPKFLEGQNINGFNLGYCRNIQEVFGKEILLWPFPIITNHGEGVSFPINETVLEAQSLLLTEF